MSRLCFRLADQYALLPDELTEADLAALGHHADNDDAVIAARGQSILDRRAQLRRRYLQVQRAALLLPGLAAVRLLARETRNVRSVIDGTRSRTASLSSGYVSGVLEELEDAAETSIAEMQPGPRGEDSLLPPDIMAPWRCTRPICGAQLNAATDKVCRKCGSGR